MDHTGKIVDLYSKIFDLHKKEHNVSEDSFKQATEILHEAYLPSSDWRRKTFHKAISFNDAANRCAYLHEYAMLHTGLMCDIFSSVLITPEIRNQLYSKRRPNICSLSGGPGADIVSWLFVFHQYIGYVPCNVSVIDFDKAWEPVFESILSELRTGLYGYRTGNTVSSACFGYKYLSMDVLNFSPCDFRVIQEIKNADLITMVNFVSGTACSKSKLMIKKIFHLMKNGSMLLFVDTSRGGFDNLVMEAALENRVQAVYGPLKYYEYKEDKFRLQRYGFTSQSEAKVSVQMWKKPQYSDSAYQENGQIKHSVQEKNIVTTNLKDLKKEANFHLKHDCCRIS